MIKTSKRALLVVFLAVLIASIAYISLIPPTQATTLTTKQKGISILNNVLGLDLSKYALASSAYQQNALFLGTPQETLEYYLTSKSSRLDILCTFANGNLQMLQILNNTGLPTLTAPISANIVTDAQNFLGKYQTYTSGSIYSQLQSTLNNIDASKNITQSIGNTKLEVNTDNSGNTNFKWTYTINGIIAPTKFVALGFTNNSISFFVDNWQLQTISSTSIKISENQAESIAMNIAKAHSWSVALDKSTFTLNNFNETNIAFSTLLFDYPSHTNATLSDSPTILYPIWRVGVQLNKWYGDLYGIEVDIRADSGQVLSENEALSTLHPIDNAINPSINETGQVLNAAPTTKEQSLSAVTTSFLLVAVFVPCGITAFMAFLTKKRPYSYGLPFRYQLRTIKGRFHSLITENHLHSLTAIILICVIAFPTLLVLTSVPPVKATTPVGTAVVWGSESIGQLVGQQQPYFYWRKEFPEILCQQSTAGAISSWFSNNGWAGPNGQSIDEQGNPGSFKDNIISTLSWLKQNSADDLAIVDFDHGVGETDYQGHYGWHYMCEDEEGNYIGYYPGAHEGYNAVYDDQICSNTNPGEVTFAYISTCMSADYNNGYYGGIGSQNPYHVLNGDPYPWNQGQLPDQTFRGIPYAYMHRVIGSDMSSDGYHSYSADAGSQVFIGFPIGSPSLTQWIPDPNTSGWLYGDWVPNFFGALVNYHQTVHDALDTACRALWGWNFDDYRCCLYQYGTGFKPYWYVYGQDPNRWPLSWMAVYGNSFIQLPYQQSTPGPHQLGIYAEDNIWGNYPMTSNVWVDGNWVGTTPVTVTVDDGYHTIQVDDGLWDPIWSTWVNFQYMADWGGNYYGNPAYVPVTYDTFVVAYYGN